MYGFISPFLSQKVDMLLSLVGPEISRFIGVLPYQFIKHINRWCRGDTFSTWNLIKQLHHHPMQNQQMDQFMRHSVQPGKTRFACYIYHHKQGQCARTGLVIRLQPSDWKNHKNRILKLSMLVV